MNHALENHRNNLFNFTNYITQFPFLEMNKQSGKKRVPRFVEHQMFGISNSFDLFNKKIIVEADEPINGNAYKVYINDGFFPIIKKYCEWYNVNLIKIEREFGEDNIYSAIRKMMEMTQIAIELYLDVKAPSKKDEISYTFKSLFKNDKSYNKVIKTLIKNKFIVQGNNSLEWIFTPTKKYTTPKTIIALCVVLEIKDYLKQGNKSIYKYIKNEFDIIIDKGNYSRSSNGFKDDYDKPKTTNYSYTSLFRYIL